MSILRAIFLLLGLCGLLWCGKAPTEDSTNNSASAIPSDWNGSSDYLDPSWEFQVP